jgi:hypothetical protein
VGLLSWIRLSSGIATTAPAPRGGGGGRRPGGVGDANILKPETGAGAFAPSPSAPPPEAIPPTVQCMGKSLKNELARGFTLLDTAFLGYPRPGQGRRYSHTETRDRGGGFCPLPVCPSPRGDTSHGPVYGDTPRIRPSPGIPGPGRGGGGGAKSGHSPHYCVIVGVPPHSPKSLTVR